MPDFDFGFDGNQVSNDTTVTNTTTEDVTPIDGQIPADTKDATDKEDITVDDKQQEQADDNKDDNNDSEKLEEGTIIEVGDKKYTVDANGNIVDKDGKIFKEAKDANDWIKSFETETSEEDKNKEINVDTIKATLGVEIVDEDGKPVEFENTPEGISSYVKAYVEHSRQEIVNNTIDTLYSKYPILENVINYYVANGNSLEGFNELRDRSTIELDINNEAQCEAIIREAWREEARKGNVDNYIQYLKSQNLLGATAEEELKAMVEKDKAVADELAKEADKREKEYIESQKEYWGTINNIVTRDKKIGNYQIPDTIIRVRNGQRTSATPQDFFNYVYQVDKNGHSQYENDLIREAQESPQTRINNDLIAAFLKFTGGSYESLVKMAINEEKVKTIKIKSKETRKPTVKINKPVTDKNKTINFGY